MRLIILSFLAMFLATPVFAQETDTSEFNNPKPFGLWLQELKQEALSKGISQATVDAALGDVAPIPEIIELDRKQPETTITLAQYLSHILTETRISKGRELFNENRALLMDVSQHYHVQPGYIVALWGIESSFGEHMGDYSIVESLATLAYDGRRSDFFRGELMKALTILNEGDITPDAMTGSWAGAMGQCQFMPSSYLQFAVDYDHDGKRDIWNDQADVFASIANYLSTSGWNGDEGWGFPVTLPANFDRTLADIKQEKPMNYWAQLGVKRAGGSPLPHSDSPVSLILVGDGDDARPYIVTGNYKVILKWNRSRYFATAVGMLAERIEKQ